MIDFKWFHTVPAEHEPELSAMLAEAAHVDAEAGFPRLALDDPVGAGASHLLVWLQPDDRSGRQVSHAPSLAAYLRVDPLTGDDAGTGEVSYVVRPAYRSRGITTMLAEKIGLELAGDGGWQGTGVSGLRIWARGNHPAALRMSLRFRRYGITATRREWQLLTPLREGREIDPCAGIGPVVRPAAGATERAAAAALWVASGRRPGPPAHADVLVAGSAPDLGGAVWIDPDAGLPTEYGVAGRVFGPVVAPGAADTGAVRALLVAGLEALRDAGLRVGATVVDAEDKELVHEARTVGLTHDRTDVLYVVGPC